MKRIHGELKQRVQAELQTHPAVEEMKQTSGKYTEIELVRSETNRGQERKGKENQKRRALNTALTLTAANGPQEIQKLAAMLNDKSTAVNPSQH